MADDEQFSLCWNNFNSNLSAGFHESLCRGDLVDVTLAAEGQFVKAHRLVLSVCSPYFRKMFTQMPANQHAFVFLKDVSHTALKDLIQFMYCGEVNVKQEALPAFISTAEALQIKGLTDSDPPPSQSPAEPSTPTPQIQQIPSPRVRQRTSTSRSYKIETVDDSGDDNKQPTQIVIQTSAAPPTQTIAQQTQHLQQQTHHQHTVTQQLSSAGTPTTTTTVVTQKRPSQRSIGAPHIKRTKSTIDPLDAAEVSATTTTSVTPQTQQITVQTAVVATETKSHLQQQATETEYIDLPIELPTKSEPDYTEDAGEVESADHDATYVEDDSYGELRYDESYFTENEDAAAANAAATTMATGGGSSANTTTATTSKAIVKQQPASFSDSSFVETAADQSNNDAQDLLTVSAAPPVKRGRGRPKQKLDTQQPEKLSDKILSTVNNNNGLPAVYASTTKGGMKLIYDGHHFRYSFRKGQYSIFQCCYKENKEECKVRIVSDQKRVYPLDGEHVHFIQATDKSVTAVVFEPGDMDADADEVSNKQAEQEQLLEAPTAKDKQTAGYLESIEIFPTNANMRANLAESDDIASHSGQNVTFASMETEELEQPVYTADNMEIYDAADDTEYADMQTGAANAAVADANDFREKIKKRLQKALLGKKK